MSKLSYLISVWGGSESYLIRALQVLQNKVARAVTRQAWSTPTSFLLAEFGWLSVLQLAMYHTTLLVYKVMKTGTPSYIHSMFGTEYMRTIRQALQGILKPSTTRAPSTELATSNFRFRALQ